MPHYSINDNCGEVKNEFCRVHLKIKAYVIAIGRTKT